MLMLRDIMTSDVFTLAPEMTIREAMEALAKRHVTGAPVVSGDTLVGVATASDLLAFVSSLAGVPTAREVGAWEEWGESTDDEIATVDDEPASTSFVDWWDDAGADVAERVDRSSGPEWNPLEEHTVEEAMTRGPLLTLPLHAAAEAAAQVMMESRVHRVLVVDGERLVGIVTTSDIAGAVAAGRLTRRVYVFGR